MRKEAYKKNQSEYYSVIRETYGDTLRWTADAYEHLVYVRFLGMATLNYDPQLPKALLRHDSGAFFSVYPSHDGAPPPSPLEFSKSKRRLMALHGYADPKNKQWKKK